VPIAELLSEAYAAKRRELIDPAAAMPEMPQAGIGRSTALAPPKRSGDPGRSLDTSYVSVVDHWGNAFSATPSDISNDTPVIPGLGIAISSRGSQSWADPSHASSLAPGKRPRLTPSPAMACYADGSIMAFGTPGGDVQAQAMLQVFLGMELFGLSAQAAVDAPRFGSYSFPDSFEPHSYFPGRVAVEKRLADQIGSDLAGRGHEVQVWPDGAWRAGAVCIARRSGRSGLLAAAADPRRPAYAIGW
jgi:gamma-glutamyltranspeptidase/glutathione hydrolase